MKHTLFTLLAAVLLILTASCGSKSETSVLHSQQDSLSWAMGQSLAKTAQSGFYDFDMEIVAKAFRATLDGKKSPMDEQSYQAACDYLAFLASSEQAKHREEYAAQAARSQKEYFAKLESDPAVKKAPQGFYYQVLKPGQGPAAKAGLRIKFHFRSKNMLTGDLVEETFGRRDPIVHTLADPMFPALQQAIALMNAGAHYRFYFPADQVTNASGVPADTPLIYEVELYEIYPD